MSSFIMNSCVVISILLIYIIILAAIIAIRHIRENNIKVVDVKSIVTFVKIRQSWRIEDKWERDEWSGDMKRKKVWGIYYDVTARWVHPSTGQIYTARTCIWADDCINKPVKGDPCTVRFDQHNPDHSYIVLQSLPELLPP